MPKRGDGKYESSDEAMAQRWNRIALAVVRKIGKRIGFNATTRMSMNTALRA